MSGPADDQAASTPPASAAMDDDVAAILGLSPRELEGGAGAIGWIENVRRSNWAPTAAAILLPALVAAMVASILLPDAPREPQVAERTPPEIPMAMSAASAPARPAPQSQVLAQSIGSASPAAARLAKARAPTDVGPARLRRADPGSRPAPERDRQVVVAELDEPRSVERPIESTRARYTDVADDPVRRQIVAARLDAVDALRALRQK